MNRKNQKLKKQTDHTIDTLLVDNIDIPNRTIILNEGIDDDSLALIIKGFQLLGQRPITILLNSGGGDVGPGLAICDLIQQHGNITISVVGQALSMAAVILQAAKTRKMTSSSYLMLHSGIEEPAADHKKNVKAYLRLTDKLDDIMDAIVLKRIQKKHPKYSWAQFRKETMMDVYFTAEQAKKWNLIDKVV